LIPALVNAIIVPPLVALLVSSALVAIVIRSRFAMLALDRPNERSLHATPTPRLGGIGIVAGVGAAWWYAMPAIDSHLVIALGILAAISLYDDLLGVAIAWRLLVHLAAALLAVSTILNGSTWWLVAFAALVTAWMINLYNFMDGADGLAGGMAVIGFGSYGIAALIGGDLSFAATNLSIAAAALGFLVFNFPPARIFMGDVGAIPLGCLAAAFGVAGWTRGDWPLWFGIVIFSPFIVDASLTLLRRALRGIRVWHAHREHYYQRLIHSGWGHRKTVLAEYALMLLCSSSAVVGLRLERTGQTAIVCGVALAYLALIFALDRKLPRVF
jgi:UDP-GlcNAc:undecaprenyl-phosphate/decaprenyl-phosphate GlcNAc-1-phosphate transferase